MASYRPITETGVRAMSTETECARYYRIFTTESGE